MFLKIIKLCLKMIKKSWIKLTLFNRKKNM